MSKSIADTKERAKQLSKHQSNVLEVFINNPGKPIEELCEILKMRKWNVMRAVHNGLRKINKDYYRVSAKYAKIAENAPIVLAMITKQTWLMEAVINYDKIKDPKNKMKGVWWHAYAIGTGIEGRNIKPDPTESDEATKAVLAINQKNTMNIKKVEINIGNNDEKTELPNRIIDVEGVPNG